MTKKSGIRFIYVGELIRTPYAPDHRGIIEGLTQLRNDGIISEFKIVDPVLFPERVVRDCNDFKPDIVVHGNTDSLDGRIGCREIKTDISCFFMGDVQPNKYDYNSWSRWVSAGAGAFHAIFVSNRDQLSWWEQDFKAPAYFWPHGCFVPDKLEKGPEFHNLLFIGSMSRGRNYEARYNLVTDLANRTQLDHITADDVEGRNDIWYRMPQLYHTANFVLDVSHFWHLNGYASGRYWYSGGLGACSLTKWFPGCEEFYANRSEKLYFNTPEEAIALMEEFKDQIDSIKWNAYMRNKTSHTYRIRFLDMFNKLGISV